jgi:hypothetical protein
MEGRASMLKKIYTQDDAFNRYFREAEGDDDTVSVTVAPRANRGTDYNDDTTKVNVSPRNNRGTDYSADDTQNADNPTDDTDNANDNTNDNTTEPNDNDNPADANEPASDEATDYSSDNADDNADTTQDEETTGDEGGDDEETTGDEGGDDEDVPDGPDTGDDGTDYTSTGDDEGSEDDTGNDEESSENETSGEDTKEKENKFYMYKRYMYLYNTLDGFIDKIQLIVKDDVTQNAVLKTVTNNLIDLKQNMFDYMTLRYKSASYIQILLYFETAISIIKLNFELLRNNKINLKQN